VIYATYLRGENKMKPKLTNVSGKYGAPMGRSNRLTKLPVKLYLERLVFQDCCYDKGGAYWGGPDTLYRACGEDDNEQVECFVRALSRKEAKVEVLRFMPQATFFR